MVEESKKESPIVSDQELEGSFELPANFVNRFFVTVSSNGVRIAFAEQRSADKKVNFRNAVMMSHQDAISLRDLLDRMLSSIEETKENEADG